METIACIEASVFSEETDDYKWIIEETTKGDSVLVKKNHFCSPAGYSVCTDHTFSEIFSRTLGDIEFHAVFSGKSRHAEGLVGYICLDAGLSRVFCFGIRHEFRKTEVMDEFICLMRNLAGEKGEVLIGSYNFRDIKMAEHFGFKKKGYDFMNEEIIYKLR